ncbi:MAG: septal ring lytic transglycosylase RlpA family protein [Smithella sp.]|jgi:rare lipoprotein A
MMGTKQIFVLFVLSLVSFFMCGGCQTISQSIIADNSSLEQIIAAYSPPDGAEGTARYYAKRFNGRRTSSGEIYNSKKLTAAHPALPLGTRVKVVNLASSKSVTVKINDRCRNHEEVFIDLSREAARQLGFLGYGTANVRIIIIDEDDSSGENPAISHKGWFLF